MYDNNSSKTNSNDILILELTATENKFEFSQSISSALSSTKEELLEIDKRITETEKTLQELTPECDIIDYVLSASSGALCGIIDIFLVGKPGESPIGDITDNWFADRTKDFAKFCKWDSSKDDSLKSAIKYLEKKFKIPYDQSVGGNIFRNLINLTPNNHHFKSLGHNPTLLGLFISILNQFTNTSSFVSEGELITLNNSDGNYELEGDDIPSKLFCGFVNWLGHLFSDISGSSGSKGRGMGIPSPIWSWANDVIAIKRKIGIPSSEFNKTINNLALEIYKKGYDTRFQASQAIPVLINEMTVRIIYSIRRAIHYYSVTRKDDRSFKLLWKSCEPFSNATVKRMLTVAHGTFCLADIGDATIRGIIIGGGSFNVVEFVMCLNIIGIGRFAFSLYGEVNRGVKASDASESIYFLKREKIIINDYIDGLLYLSELYDDQSFLNFTEDLKNSDLYVQAFEKTVELAEKRNVPDDTILRTKRDIDSYFRRGD